jgi:hypothetical protein
VRSAILLLAYNRWDLVEKRLFELAGSNVKPTDVVLSVDGSLDPEFNQMREEYVYRLKKLNLPFEFEVILRPINLGCSSHIITAVTEILIRYDSVIVIEDDVSVSPFFLGSMNEAFDLIARHGDVGTIGCFSNFHKNYHFPFFFKSNYWRKTRYFSAWGWGTTKEFWKSFVRVSEIKDLDEYLSESSTWSNFSRRRKNIWLRRFNRGVWDFNVQLALFKNDKFNLLPALRIIDNEGFSDERSTHTKHRRPRNLFGEGKSNEIPNKIEEFRFSPLKKIFWGFVDSNLWAADGLFNARGREAGIRTMLRSIFNKIMD